MSAAQLAREVRTVERLMEEAAADGNEASFAWYVRELRELRAELAKQSGGAA